MFNNMILPGDFAVSSAVVVAASDRTVRDHPPDRDGELQQYLDGLDLPSELHHPPHLHLLLVQEAEQAQESSE